MSSESEVDFHQLALEQQLLAMLLEGDHPALEGMRLQLAHRQFVDRWFSGVGFFVEFSVPGNIPRVGTRDFVLSGVDIQMPGLPNGAGSLLFVVAGAIHCLEVYIYDDTWPESVEGFRLAYGEPWRTDQQLLCAHMDRLVESGGS